MSPHCTSTRIVRLGPSIHSSSSRSSLLPVIILDALNGATSIRSKSLFGDSAYASIAIAPRVVALLTSILNTIGSYFAWARRAEGRKQTSLQCAKLYRFLSMETSLPRHEGRSPGHLLKYVRQEYGHFAETSPLIPPSVVEVFKSRFSGERYKDIAVPEETDGLSTIAVCMGNPTNERQRDGTD